MSPQKEFAHLHVHSEYSLLDGLSRIKDLAKRAKELNQPAIALTDHGSMHGTIQFYRACKAADVKPILGVESYLAQRGMGDKDPNYDRKRYHLLLLAQNQTGYLNLLKLSSEAQLNGYYYKPRIDWDLLEKNSAGVITTTSCLAGEIPQAIMADNPKKADELMGRYATVFGKDRFFVELQDHDIPEIKSVNETLIEMGKRHGLKFLATNDVHYTHAEDANPHDVLLCIQTSALYTDKKRMRMSDNGYYLKSYDEMHAMFGHVEGALSNSLLIAEMCNVDPEPPGYHLPLFPVPAGDSAESYVLKLCEKGLIWRYGAERAANDPDIRARLKHELGIINQMGFAAYFLIVWDMCEFAREADIWWNVRGSGAASIVAYSLGITGIDPLANGLIFERFLNPGRVSMPDIDLDYPDNRRQEMIDYTVQKYGNDKVAQIITFGTMGARAAIRDVGRAMDVPLTEVDRLAKMIMAIPGKPCTIDNALDKDHEFYNAELAEEYKNEPIVQNLINTAKNLEGVSRHASTHAAGVIVSDKPLIEYCPLSRNTSGNQESNLAVTQWPMEIVESIGLLKVDFLGLSTLTVMRKAAELVEKRHGTKYLMDTIPYDEGHVGPDPSKKPEALFDLLGKGEVAGVFQVEGAGMRRLMMDMKPRRFDHIIAAISLYRPGPMENIPEYVRRMHSEIYDGKDIVEYHHADLEPILKDTYGILVYQEQIIRIASDLAGYEPGEADMIRKAVSKKKKKLMEEHRIKFTDGAMARGYSREVCEGIWGDIEFFARYGFNKAHAADYAVITCQTAFLKAHYMVEYMTALLSVERNNTEKVSRYLGDCRRLKIEVAPPDINSAEVDFTIEDKAGNPVVRYGMGAIKNAGISAIETLLADRHENGPFKNLLDLCDRVDLRKVGKRALESMIKVGVFDDWHTRPQMLDGLERAMGYSGKTHDTKAVGQMSLFGGMMGGGSVASFAPDLIHAESKVKDIDSKTLLTWEKELIGVYLSKHPLTDTIEKVADWVNISTPEIDENAHDKGVRIVGLLTTLRTLTTKKGDAMAFGQLEDLEGSVEVVFFPRTWKKVRLEVKPDQVLFISGKIKSDDRGVKIIVESASTKMQVGMAAMDERDHQSNGSSYRYNDMPANTAPYVPPTPAQPTPVPPKSEPKKIEPEPQAELPIQEPPTPYTVDPSSDLPPWEAASPPPPPNFDDDFRGQPIVREQSTINGQQSTTNGRQPTNQLAHQPTNPPTTIFVEISAQGNWKQTFKRSLEIAGTFSGNDHLYIKLAEQPNFTMSFPNNPTQACADLVGRLQSLPGVVKAKIS